MKEKIKISHLNRFGEISILIKSPSRINLIGEHTDYNLGYALPAAVGQAMYFAMSKNENGEMKIQAYDLDESADFKLEDEVYPKGHWTGFFKTVLAELKDRGFLIDGVDCTFGGDIPIGAGMSSSSALNCGLTFGLSQLYGWGLSNNDIMLIASASEYRFGVKGGLMDQFTILNGKENHALLLDFKQMSHELIPIETGDYHFVLFNTCVKHSLVNSPYNQRRTSCANVLELLKQTNKEIQSYQDFDEDFLAQYKNEIQPEDYTKAQYVLRENARVLKAAEKLKSGDLVGFGALLWASHNGLRHDYEVSCEELDFIVDHIRNMKGVLGSRMMGGGFGGCTVHLIHKDEINEVWTDLSKAYFDKFGIHAEMYEVEIGAGIGIL